MKVTNANRHLFWDPPASTGCSIKTGAIRPGGYYAQDSQYNWWNSNAGAGGAAECCAGAMPVCRWNPNVPKNQNYRNAANVMMRQCKVVPGTGGTVESICKWFENPANCGNNV